MGKASKWLMNLLLGRREDKGKRNNICICFEEHGSLVAVPSVSPHASPFKRIWRSGKLSTKSEARARKSSRSFDPMTGALDMENQYVNTRIVSMATYEAFLTSKAIEDAAATRIQGAYRAYLARKALHALKGLVKLQALVRGHQVRKQTTSTLRCMHALMAIQVRARVQRIQTATESHLTPKRRLSTYGGMFPLEMGFKRAQKDEQHGIVKSRDGFRNRSKTKRIEQGITRCYSEEISLTKKQQNHAEFVYSTHNSPRHCPPLKSKPRTPGRSSFGSYECPCTPGYMANTQSSRAKVRSQSEPKQRPAPDLKAKVVADENGELCFC